jgi:hypothetical protein
MEPAFTVTLPTGRAAFESVIRDWDEQPRHAFSVELAGQRTLYGIWRPVFAANGHDFNVEIVSFGWADKYGVGHPNQITRTKLFYAQAANARELIVTLFENIDARKKIVPFSSRTAQFMGAIEFRNNWALLKD